MEKRLKLVIWRGLFCVPTFFPSPSKTRRNLFGMFVKSDCHPRSESTFRQIAFDFQFFIEVLTLPFQGIQDNKKWVPPQISL